MIRRYQEIYKKLVNFDDPKVCPELKNYTPGLICDTSFKYILDDRGRETAKRGLSNFYKCIGQVLAFNPKFSSIKVTDRR